MVLVSKICAAILLAAVRLLAGLLPLKVYQKLDKWGRKGDIKAAEKKTVNKRRQRIDLFLSVFLCFGAGLLLSTCFIHMIPEVNLGGQNYIKIFSVSDCRTILLVDNLSITQFITRYVTLSTR